MREIVSPLNGFPSPFAARKFNPARLFSVTGSRGFMYDLSDYSTQFQDTAATVPITGTAQSLARVNDVSGLGNNATQGTAGNRALTVIFPSSGVRNRANGSADVGNVGVWPASTTVNGITATKVGSGFDADGLPYVDIRYQGTSAGTFHDLAFLTSNSRTAATPAQQYTASAILRVVGGTTANTTGLTVRSREETAPATFVANGTPSRVTASVDTISASQVTVTTGNQAALVLDLAFTTASAIDITYRIKALQLELGSSRTSYQFNYSAQNVTEQGFTSIRGIQFDGVDDWLQTAAIDFSNSDEVTVVAGVRKLSDAARGVVVELGNGGPFGSFGFFAPSAANTGYSFTSTGGSAASTAAVSGYAAPNSSVISGLGDISGDTSTLRVNGVQVAQSVTDQGPGNYTSNIAYIGRRGGSSNPLNGVLTFLFAINRLLTANELASVEAYANARTGAY